MAKLHELLAAEGTVKTQADKVRSDLLNTFEKKRHLFGEKIVTFKPNTEGEAVTEEQSDLQSTVKAELKWIADIWAKALDAGYQIAESNMGARADVILDNGTVLLKNLPATALLELEKRTGEMHALVMGIPTLDPAKGFKPDPDRGVGVYRARDVNKKRTKKVEEFVVIVPPTEQHPAQVGKQVKDVETGTIAEQEWSGLITPAEKADMLARAEELRRAVKTARSRANEAEAAVGKVGLPLLQYVFGQ